jgi:hypothetical protein
LLKKVLIGLVAVVLLLVGGAAVAFYTVSPNVLKPYAERAISSALGRPFTIRGDLELERGWTLKVRAHDVHLANAEWSDRPDMLAVDTVEASVSLWDLVTKGQITIPEVTLDTPVASLERNERGETNWQLGSQEAADAAQPESRSELPYVGKLTVRNAQIDYHDAQADRDISTKLTTLTAVSEGEQSRMKVNAEGQVGELPLNLDGTFGSYQLLANSTEPFPVEGSMTLGKSKIALKGAISDPASLDGIDLQTDMSAEDLTLALELLEIPAPEIPPFALEGHLTRRNDEVRMEDLSGKVGDSVIAGWAAFSTAGDRPKVSADLTSERFDLDDFAGLTGLQPAAGPGETASPRQEEKAEDYEESPHVIPEGPLHADSWPALDADVHFRGKRISAGKLPLENVDVHVVLDHGRLRIEPLKATVAGAPVEGKLALDTTGKPPQLDLDVAATGLELERFLGEFGLSEYGRGRISSRVAIKGEGDSLRSILDTSDGQMALTMEQGALSALIIEALHLDVAEVLAVLFGDEPGNDQELFDVRCLVADFQLADGIAYDRTFVLDTTDSLITLKGAVNLSTEAIELDMNAEPKDNSLMAAPSTLHLRGTFKEPRVVPDMSSVGIRSVAAAAVGVVLTPLAAFLPFIEIGTAEDAPCGALVSKTENRGDVPEDN